MGAKMATHNRCHWNCGGTDCNAPERPPREDGTAINIGHYSGTYGGYTTEAQKPQTLLQRFKAFILEK
jgi:hypothetical protein